ncbi:hypothetical protein F5Y04DRAFT_247068 [Hypomontagnella monticulosa]|nr:hypothetical protein F5Y04DRAFT_247068 [Hypomontagnella monticulosa]
MAPVVSRHPTLACAESIAALHLLHVVPTRPSSNPVTDIQRRPDNYTLSFEKELKLSSTLSFLAYFKDDANNIPAVCIEEDVDADHLNVLLALNQSKGDRVEQAPEELRTGFNIIFALLAKADNNSLDIEANVFKAIVIMCSKRILHRLRLIKGSKNTQSQPITEVLQRALDSLKRSPSPPSSFLEKGREVLRLVDAWTKHRTQARIQELVDGIYHLRQIGGLHDLIGNIPNRDMDPGQRTHLFNMIAKVSRYREAARFLFRTAKKMPLARKMRLVFVQLPQEAFSRVPCNACNPNLDRIVSLTEGLKKDERDLSKICRFLKTTEVEAKREFVRQTRKTMRESRIHAEIQLLYYCESQISNHRLPRVVCSSKKACWLCNEFILMHGKLHMPGCHGKVYPGWRLPALHGPLFDDFAMRFNSRLQIRLADSLHTLFARRERTTYPDPHESSLLSLPWSDSTLSTLTPPPSDSPEESPPEIDLPPSEEWVTFMGRAYAEEVEEALAAGEGIAPETAPASGEAVNDIPETPHNLAISETLKNDLIPESGQSILKWIRIGKTATFYKAGPIEVQIEYAGSSDPEAGDRRQKLLCALGWVDTDEAEKLINQTDTPVIDVSLLDDDEIEHNTDEDGCIYIANGDAVLKIYMGPITEGSVYY